jgi:hypothetical protein
VKGLMRYCGRAFGVFLFSVGLILSIRVRLLNTDVSETRLWFEHPVLLLACVVLCFLGGFLFGRFEDD